MMKPRISLFAEHEREDRRTKIGDPLVGLTKHVDFEALAAGIDGAAPRPSRAKGGRPPYPTVLMVKILVSILVKAATDSRRKAAGHSHPKRTPLRIAKRPPVLTDRRHPIALNAATRSRWSPPALCCDCGHHLKGSERLNPHLIADVPQFPKSPIYTRTVWFKQALNFFLRQMDEAPDLQ